MENKNEWWRLELKELFVRQELSGVPLPQTVILFIEYLAGYFVQEASRRKEIEVWEEARRMMIGNGCESGLCLKSWNEINSKLAALKGEKV